MNFFIEGENGGKIPLKEFKEIENKNTIIGGETYIIIKNEIDIFNLLLKNKEEDIKSYLIEDMILIEFPDNDFYYSLEELNKSVIDKVVKNGKVNIVMMEKNNIDIKGNFIYNNITKL